MASIDNKDEFDTIKRVFNDLWSAATVRLSLIQVDDTKIPNGEIIFHRESRSEKINSRYSIDGFEIYEETVLEPFNLVNRLYDGDLRINGDTLNLDFIHSDGNTSGVFQRGVRESRVFKDRPLSEVNTVFRPELSDRIEDEYQNVVDEVDERIKTADEPFFDSAKCEYYYFDHHVKEKSSADPLILLFADPQIRFDVNRENELELRFPTSLADETTIFAYPQRPYGERKGWKIPVGEQQFESTGDGLAIYTEQLELADLQEVYLSVYVEDELMRFERHHNSDIDKNNDRFRIFEKYDQRQDLPEYLGGKDPDQFEVAVLNLLSLAGYIVQWFGEDSFSVPNYARETNTPQYEEIDIIAHAPDGSHIAFVECTNQRISEKTSLLDRMENIASGVIDQEEIDLGSDSGWAKDTVPCIATPQSPEQLSDQVVENLESMGVVVLDSERLVDIYTSSKNQEALYQIGGEPGFWWQQRPE
jgi:hypothetical protein